MELHDIWIYFANGLFLQAKGFGKKGTSIGEAVFNTSMTGYQEIISDPSYAGQFIVFCMPEIGIVGCNPNDMESKQPFAKGVLIRNLSAISSNFRATQDLATFFDTYNLMGICNVDTREIVKMIRNNGAMMMIASSELQSKEELESALNSAQKIHEIDYVSMVSTKDSYLHDERVFDFNDFKYPKLSFDSDKNDKKKKRIVAIDYGIKRNILNELSEVGLIVEVLPHTFNAKELIERYKQRDIGGIFLSNGPGDPVLLQEQIDKIKQLISAKIPIFGICLGHQLLSNAHGYKTYKLKFGQHGGNHPVKNMQTDTIEITSQNHNYNVPESIKEVAIITHRNLFDNTIEGVCYKNSPIFSVQHHPESSPGPREASKLFAKFEAMVDETL